MMLCMGDRIICVGGNQDPGGDQESRTGGDQEPAGIQRGSDPGATGDQEGE